MVKFQNHLLLLRGIIELSDEDIIVEDPNEKIDEIMNNDPLEVRIVKEKEEIKEDDLDYEIFDFDIEKEKDDGS